jgi:hypothetical protein
MGDGQRVDHVAPPRHVPDPCNHWPPTTSSYKKGFHWIAVYPNSPFWNRIFCRKKPEFWSQPADSKEEPSYPSS